MLPVRKAFYVRIILLSLSVALFGFLAGCTTVVQSDKRVDTTRSIRIAPNTTVSALGAVNMHVPLLVDHVDLFPSGFMIRTAESIVYIDPLVVDSAVPADYILITHDHADHLSLPDIKRIHQERTVIVGPPIVAKKLENYTVKEIKPGERIKLGDIQCEAVPAYNTNALFLGIRAHRKSEHHVGYIITTDGARIYHAGDTDFIPEMKEISNITLALLPIAGAKLTMSTEEAASFVNRFRPKMVVPMHYQMGTDEPEKFMRLVEEPTKVVLMDRPAPK
ncbi:MAG: hypothetical protein GF344_03615 [Chitinivibrionales bacterium]|nr:hypothetical protein [Chitinivibrionales bacterium]MBD3356159.1 hypothetical protein [Chitinivibrionales bacterium]